MNRSQMNLFKMVLFVLGLAVIAAVFYVINPGGTAGVSDGQKFLWVNIIVCYFLIFVPFLFSSINIKNIDTKITSTTNIWLSVIIFVIAAGILSVLVMREDVQVSIRLAVLIELVLFFVLTVFTYFGYAAGAHIGEVQAAEQKSLGKIAELKNAFEMLSLKTDMLADDFHDQKAKIKKLCDDVRYMSPVDTDAASSLEGKLIVFANVLSEPALTPSDMDAKIMELTNLINQRKLLRK